jgi:hypothetical protein
VNSLMDAAVAYRHVVNVNDHLWRHDQHDIPVPDRDLELQGRLADGGDGEIDDHVAVTRLHQQATRYRPGSVPPDHAVRDLQVHQILGFRGRGWHRAGGSRQVDQENLKLAVRSRGQRGLKPFV